MALNVSTIFPVGEDAESMVDADEQVAEYEFTTFQKAFVLIPKASGFLSMMGSMSIILHIARSKKRRSLVYHRLLLGMSVSDFISSFFLFLSSWLVPQGTKMYLASGTMATCTVHGLFSQAASLTTPSYNAALSVFYVLVVCLEMPDQRVRAMEPFLHAWPIVLGLGTAIAGLPLELYNPAGFHCWISGLPSGCDTKDDVECIRGNYSWVFRWAFFYAWIWCYFLVIAICIGSVYYKVLKQEQRNDRYSVSGQLLDRSRSRRVAHQAFLYVGAYYLTFLFGTITRSMQLTGTPVPEGILICFVVFYPLQGFFNAFIYMMPRYFKWRQNNGVGSSFFGTESGGSGFGRRSSSKPLSTRRLMGRTSSDDSVSGHNRNTSTDSMNNVATPPSPNPSAANQDTTTNKQDDDEKESTTNNNDSAQNTNNPIEELYEITEWPQHMNNAMDELYEITEC